jgi:glycine/D-amino acid oxidase-like deaminating enzyme
MYRFERREPSYWEATAGTQMPQAVPLSSNEQCDVAIIGGGYTGLSAAYHLCRDSDLDVRVLEAGHIGWGASGRNGGFCSIGGTTLGDDAMIRRYGLEETRAWYRSQVEAIELVQELIVGEKIDSPRQGNSEVAIACSARGFENLKEHAKFQYRVLGLDTKVVTREEFADSYFDSPLQQGAAILKPTFGLHPLRFVQGLARAAELQGARVHALSEVRDWSKDGETHVLRTRGGTISAKHVVVATNGFSPEHLHRGLKGRSMPLISSIAVTRPMSDDEIARHRWQTDSPAITALRLLNYFRLLPDGRFMFGGRGSADGSDQSAAANYTTLVARMHELFPGWREVDIDYRWHGLVCMTRRMTPAIGRLADDPSVFFAFGYHGNGVNTATWSGKQVARWLASSGRQEHKSPDWLPAMICGMPGRFPLSSLRLTYLQAVIAALRMRQRFS